MSNSTIMVESHRSAATLYASGELTAEAVLRAIAEVEQLPNHVRALRVDLRAVSCADERTLRALEIALRDWRAARRGMSRVELPRVPRGASDRPRLRAHAAELGAGPGREGADTDGGAISRSARGRRDTFVARTCGFRDKVTAGFGRDATRVSACRRPPLQPPRLHQPDQDRHRARGPGIALAVRQHRSTPRRPPRDPGSIGALIGVATVLANVDGATIRPLLAILLMLVGVRILFRFSQALPANRDTAADAIAGGRAPEFDERGVEVAATAGGVTNGLVGAWGPVVTPFLLHRGLPPRYTIGSVNTAE